MIIFHLRHVDVHLQEPTGRDVPETLEQNENGNPDNKVMVQVRIKNEFNGTDVPCEGTVPKLDMRVGGQPDEELLAVTYRLKN